MSAPIAGKFQDHYIVLDVDPKSDSATIQRAYSMLAQRYHPTKGTSPSKDKFDEVNLAYETLSDPTLRREFDNLKGIGPGEAPPTFSGMEFFEALGREGALRSALLCLLYDRRRTNPLRPSLSMRQIESMLTVSSEALAFTLWYLKQRSLVRSDDKSSLHITVEGMDYLEHNRPAPKDVMSFVKRSALAPLPPSAS
jgi:curved DNA-binding protein CbpA